MLTGRFIPIIGGRMQGMPQELQEPERSMTIEEVAALGWYEVLEVDEVDLPAFNPQLEIREEYNYDIDIDNCKATPLYRVRPKRDMTGTPYENSCPLCVDDLLEAADGEDNVVLQSLAKGELKTVDTI